MVLSVIDYYNGITSLVFVVISFIIGLKLIHKYYKYKVAELGLVGLTWLGVCEVWIPTAVSFITVLFFGLTLSPELYFILAFTYMPIAMLFWLIAITKLLYQEKKALILTSYLIYALTFEIILFYLLLTNPSCIGERVRLLEATYTMWMYAYLVSIASIFFITGILFAWKSLKSDNKETKLKAKFLLTAQITLYIISLLEAFFTHGPMTFIIYKIFLISSAFEFYLSFFLPEWLKNILSR
ncbi:MAG: hypothetical protein EU539_04585 [Promethearchaeota archaeon]|nr:MAG: hypothetical protein EU539_04585 [Candidatus Lokiarchaeota archaeon]